METVKKLTSIQSPSGYEFNALQTLKEMLLQYTGDVKLTRLNSVVGFIPSGKENAPKLMLAAHIDSVCAYVTEILSGGFVKISGSGMDPRVMLNSEYRILTKKGALRALPCVLPPHLQAEAGKVPAVSEMLLDLGMPKEKLEEMITVGDPIIYKPDCKELINGRAACASADNRISCAAVIEALEKIKGKDIPCDIIVAFTAQEEAGASGAATTAFEYQPDEAIILDVTFAETPDTKYPEAGKMAGGPMIGVAPLLSKDVTARLRSAADAAGVKWQTEVMSRTTGTDADIIAKTGKGIACGMLSIPIRYMHTSAEVFDYSDIETTAAALAEYIVRG